MSTAIKSAATWFLVLALFGLLVLLIAGAVKISFPPAGLVGPLAVS